MDSSTGYSSSSLHPTSQRDLEISVLCPRPSHDTVWGLPLGPSQLRPSPRGCASLLTVTTGGPECPERPGSSKVENELVL